MINPQAHRLFYDLSRPRQRLAPLLRKALYSCLILDCFGALRQIVRLHAPVLYQLDISENATEIDRWLDFTKDSLSSPLDFKRILSAMKVIDSHLTLRSFIVGYQISLADFALWGALRECPGFQKLIKGVSGDVFNFLGKGNWHQPSAMV